MFNLDYFTHSFEQKKMSELFCWQGLNYISSLHLLDNEESNFGYLSLEACNNEQKNGRKKDYIVVGIDYMIRSAKLSTWVHIEAYFAQRKTKKKDMINNTKKTHSSNYSKKKDT